MATTVNYKGLILIEDPASPGNPKTSLTGAGGDLVQKNFKYLIDNALVGAVVNKTTTYTLTTTDDTVLCDPTSAAFTVTLPTAVGVAGKRYTIKKIASSNNAVTVGTTSSQTIDGSTTFVIRDINQPLNVISDGSNWRILTDYTGNIPIGGIIAWHKTFTNTPSLPSGYVECNGQTLSDAGSVYNGQVIPNLNGSGGTTQRFLRGNTTSGTTGGADNHVHTIAGNVRFTVDGSSSSPNAVGDGASTSSASSLPSYFEIVWIIRIK
jgi:hypothetical protein